MGSRAVLLFSSLLAGCVEPAWAQSSGPRSSTTPRDAGSTATDASTDARSTADAGRSSALSAMFSNERVHDSFGSGGLGLGRTSLTSSSSTTGTVGLGSIGLIGRGAGTGTGTGAGAGAGRMGSSGPDTTARFEELDTRGPLPRWQIVSELSHVSARVHNCLVTARHTAAVDVPVRFSLADLRGVRALSFDAPTPEPVQRCVSAQLAAGLFGVQGPATTVTARFRFGR